MAEALKRRKLEELNAWGEHHKHRKGRNTPEAVNSKEQDSSVWESSITGGLGIPLKWEKTR